MFQTIISFAGFGALFHCAVTCRAFRDAARIAENVHRRVCFEGHTKAVTCVAAARHCAPSSAHTSGTRSAYSARDCISAGVPLVCMRMIGTLHFAAVGSILELRLHGLDGSSSTARPPAQACKHVCKNVRKKVRKNVRKNVRADSLSGTTWAQLGHNLGATLARRQSLGIVRVSLGPPRLSPHHPAPRR